MAATAAMPGEIRRRLKAYLMRDRTGLRREILRLILRFRTITIPQIYGAVRERFSVSYHALASMIGILASRVGILAVKKTPDSPFATYELRDRYEGMLTQILATD